MKKFVSVLIVLVLVAAIACAETILNLKDYSYDQLIDLNRQIAAEIMSRPEWKEVTVPAGEWIVGEDIPAGTYSLHPTDFCSVIVWRHAKGDYSNNGLFYNQALDEDEVCGKIKLEKGMLVVISDPVTFAPPVSLGF